MLNCGLVALLPLFAEQSNLHSLVTSRTADPAAPSLPAQWQHGGYQVLALPPPPWRDLPLPSVRSAMSSWYDWTHSPPSMRETYHDECVPIFQNGSAWSCDFLNVNGTSYLLQHEDRAAGQPECCVFARPWSPPRPDFPSTLFFLENTTEESVGGDTVMWFQSRGVTPQEGGPFGYGYRVRLPAPAAAAAGSGPTLVPFAFYFGALWNRANGTVDQAYTVQYFQDWQDKQPDASVWDLPPSCSTAVACTNFS